MIVTVDFQNYQKLKKEAKEKLIQLETEVKGMFNGTLWNGEIYTSFDSIERQRYSLLRQSMDNAKGQIDTFRILEGEEPSFSNYLERTRKGLGKF